MENQTSFDLNQQLQAWRENLGQSPDFQRDNVDELEAHLRDSIGRLQGTGLSVEEAFTVAAKRVGTSGSLAAESGKADGHAVWIDRIFWMLVGLQLWRMVDGFLCQAAAISFAVVESLNHPSARELGRSVQVFVNLSNLAAMAVSLWFCWWLIMRKGPTVANWMGRSSRRKIVLVVAGLSIGIMIVDNFAYVVSAVLVLKHGPHPVSSWDPVQRLISPMIQATIFLLFTMGLAWKRFKLSTVRCPITKYQPEFDLNQELRAWRENLGQSPAFCPDHLDELENHLRDSIGRLQTGGLSTEEAFEVAVKRVGTSGSLAAEFGKVNGQLVWIDRIIWMLVGLQLWIFVDKVVRQIAVAAATKYLPIPGFGVPATHRTLENVVSTAVSMGICWWLTMRKGPVVTRWIGRLSQPRVVPVIASLFVGALALDNLQNILAAISVSRHGADARMSWTLVLNLIFSVSQSFVLLILTIGLARKRLKLRMAA